MTLLWPEDVFVTALFAVLELVLGACVWNQLGGRRLSWGEVSGFVGDWYQVQLQRGESMHCMVYITALMC